MHISEGRIGFKNLFFFFGKYLEYPPRLVDGRQVLLDGGLPPKVNAPDLKVGVEAESVPLSVEPLRFQASRAAEGFRHFPLQM